MTPDFIGICLVAGFVLAAAVYGLARKLRLMAVVDLIWTVGLGLAAIVLWMQAGGDALRSAVVLPVILLWSGRLSLHLLKDRVLRGKEDPRYRRLRDHWGKRADRNFFFLFLVQVPFIAIFSIPVYIALSNPVEGWRIVDTTGVFIALVALAGESLADRQLAAFRADPENSGKVCRGGLWRYSRHPNYFFEWLHWFAYVAFAWGAPHAWLSLVGPAGMYVFLRKLTGVPHAERSSLASRGDAYRAYQRTTNTFFPWKPHKPAH